MFKTILYMHKEDKNGTVLPRDYTDDIYYLISSLNFEEKRKS